MEIYVHDSTYPTARWRPGWLSAGEAQEPIEFKVSMLREIVS